MKETAIEQAVVDYAERRGWLVRKCVYAGRRGAPDRWFFKGGELTLIEFKRPGESLSGIQKKEHARLHAAGFKVHVIDTIESGCALFD